VQELLLSLVIIFAVLHIGVTSAAFLEDYANTPTKKALNTILEYCGSHPDGNITNDLINTGNISEFYTSYTCGKAAHDKAFLEGNTSNSDTTITILH
jgi:hypothetical protein